MWDVKINYHHQNFAHCIAVKAVGTRFYILFTPFTFKSQHALKICLLHMYNIMQLYWTLYLFLSLCLSVFVSLSPTLSLFLCPSLCLSISLSLSLSLSLYVYISLILSLSQFSCLSLTHTAFLPLFTHIKAVCLFTFYNSFQICSSLHLFLCS